MELWTDVEGVAFPSTPVFFWGEGASVTPITVQAGEPGLQVAWLSYSHTTAKRHSKRTEREREAPGRGT